MAEPHASTTPFAGLDPDRVVDAVETTNRISDLRILALNSYENRVYQVGLEDAEPVIVKFYRPGRWSDAQILEEHAFTQAIADVDIPAVPPLADGGTTLHHHDGLRFAVYPRRGGRAPDVEDPETLHTLGRHLGRIHAVGALEPFRERPRLDIASFGHGARETILESDFVPPELRPAWASVSADVLARIEATVGDPGAGTRLRLHGDCHLGNVLWREGAVHFVDFDDARTGPAVQDLWMLLSGERDEQQRQLSEIVEGYEEFAPFDARELRLIEPLRSLRILHHAAWIARRWADPAFPAAFPFFADMRFWGDHVLALREQLAALQEPPLALF